MTNIDAQIEEIDTLTDVTITQFNNTKISNNLFIDSMIALRLVFESCDSINKFIRIANFNNTKIETYAENLLKKLENIKIEMNNLNIEMNHLDSHESREIFLPRYNNTIDSIETTIDKLRNKLRGEHEYILKGGKRKKRKYIKCSKKKCIYKRKKRKTSRHY